MSKGQGNSKEGFSLFTLLDRTKSKMGKQCLREWMAKPLLDPIEISKRQDAVEFFLRPECRPAAGLLLNLLQKVGAVDKILQRMQKCHSLPNDFIVLSRTLSAAVAISSTLSGDLKEFAIRSQSQAIPQGSEIDSNNLINDSSPSHASKYIAFIDGILDKCFTSVINDLRERILSIVDEEATNEAKTAVVIRPGFHEELDAAKEAFETLDGENSSPLHVPSLYNKVLFREMYNHSLLSSNSCTLS
jgi:DNA mismatch repair ATPase MutS